MKFSIITPVLNREKTIQCTIESINQQTYKDIEHIIIDGSSSDQTLDFARKKIDPKITSIYSEKDTGIYDAINKGLSLSKGDIIGILHSDDYYFDSSVLQDVVKIFKDNPSIDVVYGDLVYINQSGKVIRKWKAEDSYDQSINQGWITPHCSTFVKKTLVNKVGLYSLKYSISADYNWLLRLFKEKCKVAYLPKNLLIMRIGGASNKSLLAIIKKTYQDYKILANEVPLPIYTLLLKNLRKIIQFMILK